MSDAVSRDAVMHLLQEWTYCCDVEDLVRALPAVQPDAREAALRGALTNLPAVYAQQINTGIREVYDPLQRFYTIESVLGTLAEIKGDSQ